MMRVEQSDQEQRQEGSVAGSDGSVSGQPFGDPGPQRVSARALAREMVESGAFDELFAQVDDGELRLTGEGGFLPEMVRAALERGLRAELTSHVGYEKGDPAGRGSPNSRNGSTPKTVSSEVGDFDLNTPRDRAGTFEPQLVRKNVRRVGGLADMIISLTRRG